MPEFFHSNPLGILGASVILAFLIFMLITLWKLFRKAGEPGWKALIPVYNAYKLWDIAWEGSEFAWVFAVNILASPIISLLFSLGVIGIIIGLVVVIPLGAYNIYKSIQMANHFAVRFDKTKAFAIVALFLFQPVGLIILAWGKADYRRDRDAIKGGITRSSYEAFLAANEKLGRGRKKPYFRQLGSNLVRDKWLYLLLVPGLIYFIVFKYLPMFGIVIAFENYAPASGVFGSEWVGLKWFQSFFGFPAWTRYLLNTLILSLMNIIFFFPAPIILALLLNEMTSLRYKKLLQTMLYVPHFISIVIVVSITFVMFGPSGIVYRLTNQLLGHPINYMGSPDTFRWMIIGQTIWKETGWGTIIFLAALTNVDTQLYEAAMVDGAGRLRRLWHITLPAIRSTIVLMLILRMGSVLDTGYDHLILMANPLNRRVSQTLDVFVYEQGIKSGQFSYASAIGLMKSIVSVTLVLTSNKIAHLMGEQGLY